MDTQTKHLFELAMTARDNAYCPISHYQVGSAVETVDGNFYAGCNVESVTFNNSTHAEMNAIDTAISSGAKRIARIMVITSGDEPVFPCALCRQKIIEFGPEAEVIAATVSGKTETENISSLYPKPFTLSDIQ